PILDKVEGRLLPGEPQRTDLGVTEMRDGSVSAGNLFKNIAREPRRLVEPPGVREHWPERLGRRVKGPVPVPLDSSKHGSGPFHAWLSGAEVGALDARATRCSGFSISTLTLAFQSRFIRDTSSRSPIGRGSGPVSHGAQIGPGVQILTADHYSKIVFL